MMTAALSWALAAKTILLAMAAICLFIGFIRMFFVQVESFGRLEVDTIMSWVFKK